MANGDNLHDLIALARREMPDVPPEVGERFVVLASLNFPASRLYVASQKKRRHLEVLAAADASADTEELAKMLRVSPRRARQLRQLLRR